MEHAETQSLRRRFLRHLRHTFFLYLFVTGFIYNGVDNYILFYCFAMTVNLAGGGQYLAIRRNANNRGHNRGQMQRNGERNIAGKKRRGARRRFCKKTLYYFN